MLLELLTEPIKESFKIMFINTERCVLLRDNGPYLGLQLTLDIRTRASYMCQFARRGIYVSVCETLRDTPVTMGTRTHNQTDTGIFKLRDTCRDSGGQSEASIQVT